jgi:dehydrogenase/reductase SDR family member 12
VIERLVDAALELSVVGSYSRIGYAVRSRLEGWAPPRHIDGRVALVTGGTAGIGRAIASSLAGIGATVVVVGRDQERGVEAVGEIAGATGNDRVSFERADISDLSAVRELAARVARTYDRLDVLVHNAGVLSRRHQRTDDGIELTVAVHVVGPFLLTRLLLPALQASDSPRVITMSSGGMYTQRLDVGALDGFTGEYDGVRAYARAKRAQVELTGLWEQHAGPTGVRFVSMHPGWVATPGIESSLPTFNRLMRPILRSAEQGADTAVWLAAAPDSQLATGRFWLDRHPRAEHRVLWTQAPPGEAARLWRWCIDRAGEAPASAPEFRRAAAQIIDPAARAKTWYAPRDSNPEPSD